MSQAVEVMVAGIKLNLNTDDDPQRVRDAASMVQEQFEAIKRSGSIIDTSKIMALIALNLADELLVAGATNPEAIEKITSTLDQIVAQAEGLAKVSLR